MQNTTDITTGLAITWAENPTATYPNGRNGQQECYTTGFMAQLVRDLKDRPEVTVIDCFTTAGWVARAERDASGTWVAEVKQPRSDWVFRG